MRITDHMAGTLLPSLPRSPTISGPSGPPPDIAGCGLSLAGLLTVYCSCSPAGCALRSLRGRQQQQRHVTNSSACLILKQQHWQQHWQQQQRSNRWTGPTTLRPPHRTAPRRRTPTFEGSGEGGSSTPTKGGGGGSSGSSSSARSSEAGADNAGSSEASSSRSGASSSSSSSGESKTMSMLYEVAKMILPNGSSTEDVEQLAKDLMAGPAPYSHPKSNTKVLAEKAAARRRLEIPKSILALGKSAQAKKGPAARKGLSRRRQPAASPATATGATPGTAASSAAAKFIVGGSSGSSGGGSAQEEPAVDLEQLLRRLRPSARDVRLLPASLNPVGADAVVLLQPSQLKALVAEWNTREQRVMLPPTPL
ncbi:MAG: hypothetical protein WDW38_010680 [Sanguina aurantia]